MQKKQQVRLATFGGTAAARRNYRGPISRVNFVNPRQTNRGTHSSESGRTVCQGAFPFSRFKKSLSFSVKSMIASVS